MSSVFMVLYIYILKIFDLRPFLSLMGLAIDVVD